jgi:hypothetical protein
MSPKRTANEKPTRPWQRAEAGRYRSSDERFTIGSEGPSRWFFTDEEELDELGLARTIGPFPTLDAAKEAADERRHGAPEPSPLAERMARAPSRPEPKSKAKGRGVKEHRVTPEAKPEPEPEPARPPPKTWIEKLQDEDREAARRARRLISALASEGIADADDLVRRDVLGKQPVVATRLLARQVLAALAKATEPAAVDKLARNVPAKLRDDARPGLAASAAVEAVAEILASSRGRGGLPGWELVERDGPEGSRRPISLTGDDLRAAADRGD